MSRLNDLTSLQKDLHKNIKDEFKKILNDVDNIYNVYVMITEDVIIFTTHLKTAEATYGFNVSFYDNDIKMCLKKTSPIDPSDNNYILVLESYMHVINGLKNKDEYIKSFATARNLYYKYEETIENL